MFLLAEMSLTDRFMSFADVRVDEQREDYAHEMNGGSHTRMTRFFLAAADDYHTQSEKRHNDVMTTLQIMIANNAAYAKLYKDFGELLDNVAARFTKLELQAQQNMEHALDRLSQTLEEANTLNGVAMFEDKDGNIIDENGETVDPALLAGYKWVETDRTYEQYLEDKQRAQDAAIRVDDLERFKRETLNPAQERYQDEKTPITADEIHDFTDQINQFAADIEATPTHKSKSDVVAVKPQTTNIPHLPF